MVNLTSVEGLECPMKATDGGMFQALRPQWEHVDLYLNTSCGHQSAVEVIATFQEKRIMNNILPRIPSTYHKNHTRQS